MSQAAVEWEPRMDFWYVCRRYNVELEGPAIKPEEEPDVKKVLPTVEPFRSIAMNVIYGDMDKSTKSVKGALVRIAPMDVINKGLILGMDSVGILYAKAIYFLPDLMVAADAMMEGVRLCEEKLGKPTVKKGKVVCHVAEGDPHDIGKNMVVMFMRAAGYDVTDLGRDIPPEKVVESVEKEKPMFLTGTALMTTTMTAFPKISDMLKAKKLEVPAFGCGGGAVSREFVESYDFGVFGVKAYHASKLADSIREKKYTWKDLREKYPEVVGEYVPAYG